MEVVIIFWLGCAVVGMVIASSKNRSLAEGFFLSLLCGIFGVIIEACLPKQLPKPPRGLHAVICQRCNAAQNVPNPQAFECWQCHLNTTPIAPIPVLPPSGEKITTTCPHCQQRLKVPADSTKKKFKCFKCGGEGPMPIRVQ
jgi:hypothetical protein